MTDPTVTKVNPRVMEMNGKSISPTDPVLINDDVILDNSWIKHSFLLSDVVLGEANDIANRYWSSASAKFTDTRLGGNIGINARPQFTRYADIRVPGRLRDRNNVSLTHTKGNYGMGRYYSESIDDSAQTIYLKFGVPQFNSLLNFLQHAFDADMTSLARTGRGTSIFYKGAKAAGLTATVIAFPAISFFIMVNRVVSSFFNRPTSKFYTLKPTMPLYWSTVNMLVNTLAINRGIFPKILGDEADQQIGKPYKLDNGEGGHLDMLASLLPDTFNYNGMKFFDVYAIANKAQRIANQQFVNDYQALNNGTATSFTGWVLDNISGSGAHNTYISTPSGDPPTLAAKLNNWLMLGQYFGTDKEDGRLEKDPRIGDDGNPKKGSWWEDFVQDIDAEFRDGSQFAVFKVDHTGQVQEAFSSAVTESDISQKLNGISSQIREARFAFADGNFTDEGILGMASSAVGAVKDVGLGLIDGVTMGFSALIPGLGGSGFIDIPKHWQSSNAQLPRASYTMDLISPYGNAISQMQNIYMPLCMLLAGALPLSTGKSSYTSPFICQLWDKGRCQVRLGMIESLSITRGSSELAFDAKGHALALQVTFQVVDLSSIMHMPVSTGSLTGVDMTLDEDNILSDYLAVLAGQDMYTQIYPMAKAQLALAKQIMGYRQLTSPAYWASMFHESSTNGFLSYTPVGLVASLGKAMVKGGSNITNDAVN